MENRDTQNNKERQIDEATEYRQKAIEHEKALRFFWITFFKTGVILLAAGIALFAACYAWFVSNNHVKGASPGISASGQNLFELATLGKQSQGVYDSDFGFSDELTIREIMGVKYYVANGKSSFRVDADKNLNNYLANADLRPGVRGSFDLYVICHTDKRQIMLLPILDAVRQPETGQNVPTETEEEKLQAENFLNGHILLFSNMDDKGMYSGYIDPSKSIFVKLGSSDQNALQITDDEGGSERSFSWGEFVASEEGVAVYRLPVYWVWPEQFGNFIYTGNSYNKNLFSNKEIEDYQYFLTAMTDDYARFFLVDEATERPEIETIISPGENFQQATMNYGLYSDWYNAADERISEYITYIELGFEIIQNQ